jgi:hypothetical protein
MVPKAGLEPARPCDHQTLNLARLPIPPLRHEGYFSIISRPKSRLSDHSALKYCPGIVVRKLKLPPLAAISKSRRRIQYSIFRNNIMRLSITHIYEINCGVLARRDMDARGGYNIVSQCYLNLLIVIQSRSVCRKPRILPTHRSLYCRRVKPIMLKYNSINSMRYEGNEIRDIRQSHA